MTRMLLAFQDLAEQEDNEKRTKELIYTPNMIEEQFLWYGTMVFCMMMMFHVTLLLPLEVLY